VEDIKNMTCRYKMSDNNNSSPKIKGYTRMTDEFIALMKFAGYKMTEDNIATANILFCLDNIDKRLDAIEEKVQHIPSHDKETPINDPNVSTESLTWGDYTWRYLWPSSRKET
jgi:hypothetical protein